MNQSRDIYPRSNWYISQRLKLHYLEWGLENNPNLLCIHGGQDNCHSWDWTCEKLASSYRIIAPDLRGHGNSDWHIGSSYNVLDYLYDISQLVHQVMPEKMCILAHSMGAFISSLFAGIYPERLQALILVEGVAGPLGKTYDEPCFHIKEWIEKTRAYASRMPKKYETFSDTYNRMQDANPHLNDEQAKHLTRHGANRNEDGSYSWKFDNYSRSRSPYELREKEIVDIWQKITCPILILNAQNGFPYHRIGDPNTLKYFKHANIIQIKHAGHWLHHDQFEIYLKHINHFLNQHLS